MRTSVLYVFTTPSSVTSQGGEQPEGPSLGTPVARALCGHHRARRADEVRAASNTTCSVDCRTLGPSQGESLYQGPPADGEEVTRQDYKATKAETHHPSPCTKAKQYLHSTVRRFLTQTPLLRRSVSLQGYRCPCFPICGNWAERIPPQASAPPEECWSA